MRVLTVNAGSTSMKVRLVVDGRTTHESVDLAAALDGEPPDAVAHRVVHGGDRSAAALVTDEVQASLRLMEELAPLHQPPALDAIDRCRAAWSDTPNVACFDTAFHTTIPATASTYALPARYRRLVRSYGFHGISHSWSVARARELAPDARRVVVAHLGGGQSLCAARDGRSVLTTMGFTPLDGLVMATRSGSLDPGAVLWLQRHTSDDVGTVLERESGLLGLCGTGDMREIRARMEAGDGDAAFAFEVWRHRLVTLLGGCVAALGGLDALVFTGGIGERDPAARRAVCSSLAWLGVAVEDRDGGAGTEVELTVPGATVRTLVVPSREDLQLAAEATALLRPR